VAGGLVERVHGLGEDSRVAEMARSFFQVRDDVAQAPMQRAAAAG
jgi:hypothetical protein